MTEPEVVAVERQGNDVQLKLKVPADLSWFDGHFAELRLLPGVVQTTWVVQFARQYFPLPGPFRYMSNMKFMRLILPDAQLELRLRYVADKQELAFEYFEDAKICASGRMGFGAPLPA